MARVTMSDFKFTPIPRGVLIRQEPLEICRALLASYYRETRRTSPAMARIIYRQAKASGPLVTKAYVDQVMNEPSGQ